MIAVTFALPQESQDFRRKLDHLRALGDGARGFFCGQLGDLEVMLAHTGVGLPAAAISAAALVTHRPQSVISAGFCGGLDPRCAIADLVAATNFSAPDLLARAQQNGVRFAGVLASESAPAESVEEKTALARRTGALAVDMETAAIAEVCGRAGIPLLSVRAVSDPAGSPLPVPFAAWFDLERQRPRVPALLWFLARHPSRIGPFARFVRGLAPARLALADFLVRFIEARG